MKNETLTIAIRKDGYGIYNKTRDYWMDATIYPGTQSAYQALEDYHGEGYACIWPDDMERGTMLVNPTRNTRGPEGLSRLFNF